MNPFDKFRLALGSGQHEKALHYYAQLGEASKTQARRDVLEAIEMADAQKNKLTKLKAAIASADRANGLA